MNCPAQTEKRYSANAATVQTYRILVGLSLMFAGLYITLFCDFPKNELALLMVFASPFVILSDEK